MRKPDEPVHKFLSYDRVPSEREGWGPQKQCEDLPLPQTQSQEAPSTQAWLRVSSFLDHGGASVYSSRGPLPRPTPAQAPVIAAFGTRCGLGICKEACVTYASQPSKQTPTTHRGGPNTYYCGIRSPKSIVIMVFKP